MIDHRLELERGGHCNLSGGFDDETVKLRTRQQNTHPQTRSVCHTGNCCERADAAVGVQLRACCRSRVQHTGEESMSSSGYFRRVGGAEGGSVIEAIGSDATVSCIII